MSLPYVVVFNLSDLGWIHLAWSLVANLLAKKEFLGILEEFFGELLVVFENVVTTGLRFTAVAEARDFHPAHLLARLPLTRIRSQSLIRIALAIRLG